MHPSAGCCSARSGLTSTHNSTSMFPFCNTRYLDCLSSKTAHTGACLHVRRCSTCFSCPPGSQQVQNSQLGWQCCIACTPPPICIDTEDAWGASNIRLSHSIECLLRALTTCAAVCHVIFLQACRRQSLLQPRQQPSYCAPRRHSYHTLAPCSPSSKLCCR
jgi:hypothetical protein